MRSQREWLKFIFSEGVMMKTLLVYFTLFLSTFSFIEAKNDIISNDLSNEYQIKDFSYLIGKTGLNDELMQMHFKLYSGYVKTTNALLKTLKRIPPLSYEYGALKRRLGWEFDGMRLHEFYFENLGGRSEIDKTSALYKEIRRAFGSFEKWKGDFIATGAIRGIGWVILYVDPATNRLMNVWINEHDTGELAGGKILLIMDVFEHAYITQFGLKRGKYIQTFLNHVNWPIVLKRFEGQ